MDFSVKNKEDLTIEMVKSEFRNLRPFCCQVMSNPTVITFTQLSQELEKVSFLDHALTNYVAVPFLVHLKRFDSFKEDIQLVMLKCLIILLDKGIIPTLEMFTEFSFGLTKIFCQNKDPTKAKNLSEEILDAALSCKINLFSQNNINNDSFSLEVFGPNISGFIGHSIYVLLQFIKNYEIKEIRLKILKIIEIYAKGGTSNEEFSCKFFSFLPGIISGLRILCSAKNVHNTKLIILKTLKVLKECVSIGIKYKTNQELEELDSNFSFVIEEFSTELLTHDDIQIRLGLFEFSTNFLSCEEKGKLPKCFKTFSNNILILRQDKDPSINLKAEEFVDRFNLAIEDFTSILGLINRSNSQLVGGNEKEALLNLKKAASSLQQIKINFVELKKIISVLSSMVNNAIEKGSFMVDLDIDEMSKGELFDIFSTLSKGILFASDSDSELDNLLEEFYSIFESPEKVNFGTLFLFNNLLENLLQLKLEENTEKSEKYNSSNSRKELEIYEIEHLTTLYISILDSTFNHLSKELILISENTQKNSSSIKRTRGAEKKACFALRGISTLTLMNPSYILPIVIYSLIEHAGLSEESKAISEMAGNSLRRISDHLKFSFFEEFLHENNDLIMSELSVKVLNISLNPNSPAALIYLSEYFDFTQPSYLNLIELVFSQSENAFCGEVSQFNYLKIFLSFLTSLERHKYKVKEGKEKELSKSHEKKEIRIFDRMLEYQKSLGIGNEQDEKDFEEILNNKKDEAEVDAEDKMEDEEIEEDEEKENPEINLPLQISHRALNFLPGNERRVKIIAMDCLIKGIRLLSNSENQNQLLPLAHTVWQNLVPRFSEADYVVVRKSFELLLTLCTASGTFLKKRTIDQIFPKLASLINSLGAESKNMKEKNRVYYTYTQAYKLQMAMLEGIGQLIAAIEVQEEDLDKVVEGCLIYTQPQQHKNLIVAARNLIQMIAEGPNCRSVQMKLIANGIIKYPKLPDDSFPPIPHQFY